MSISQAEVRRIAKLARLDLSNGEVESLARELTGILEHVEAVSRIGNPAPGARDDRGPDPAGEGGAGAGAATLRADEPDPDRLLHAPEAFAPALADGFFLVPRDEDARATGMEGGAGVSGGAGRDGPAGAGVSPAGGGGGGAGARPGPPGPAGVLETARSVRDDERSATDEALAVSSAIGDDGLNAFIAHDPAPLLAQARALDSRLEAGRREGRSGGRLAGVAVGIKDNLVALDHPTTCGSRILEGFRSPYEATVVRRLRAEGALIAGKTNLDEFAMGSSTESSAFGPTRNPHDPGRVPGGSSGGSAAAVAAGLVSAALGSDTGGSVRQPAAFCGVVGLKPTYGAVSRYGLVAFASSLDQVGTFGRTVEDAAALLEVIAGHDPRDATCADRPAPELLATLDDGVEGLVVGVPSEYFPDDLDPGVRARCDAALEVLADGGAEIRPISLPHTRLAVPAYYLIAPAEASSNLARFDGVRFGARVDAGSTLELYRRTRGRYFGDEVKRRIMLGTFVLSAGYHDRYYGTAQRVRSLIARDFRDAFDAGVDVVFTPTTPTPAFRLGERTDDPYAMYQADVFTAPANLAGIPAISIPLGLTEGLPVGGQVMGAAWAEDTVVRAARAVERGLGAP